MNQIGPKLQPLLSTIGLSPEQCVLAFDDVATPLGKIKIRLRGSAGGHRGVASILEAAQSDGFPRLKLGVAPSDTGLRIVDYVLSPFQPETAPVLQSMLAKGEERLQSLLEEVRRRSLLSTPAEPLPFAQPPVAPTDN
jgi:PTH1 family peptidyl-tRNA hydrolase